MQGMLKAEFWEVEEWGGWGSSRLLSEYSSKRVQQCAAGKAARMKLPWAHHMVQSNRSSSCWHLSPG